MENKVSVVGIKEKKEYIRWFLKKYKLKRREAVWILNYLLSHEELLHNIKFVNNAHEHSRGMVISSTCNNESIPFRFYKGSLVSADAEKAFHDMRLHPEEEMCIQLNYEGIYTCPHYAVVDESYNSDRINSPEVLLEADMIIVELQRQTFLKAIDEVLDKGDQKLFMELWEMYQGLSESVEV